MTALLLAIVLHPALPHAGYAEVFLTQPCQPTTICSDQIYFENILGCKSVQNFASARVRYMGIRDMIAEQNVVTYRRKVSTEIVWFNTTGTVLPAGTRLVAHFDCTR